MDAQYPRIARLKSSQDFRQHLAQIDGVLPFDEQLIPAPAGSLAQPLTLSSGRIVSNRFCIQPMEGWDGTTDGKPTEFTIRRWRNFGASGAGLIWGGEAVAVCPDGRANPNQLLINQENLPSLAALRQALAESAIPQRSNPLIGLQLTHSGRFARPNSKTRLEPVILYHHPLLDPLFQLDPQHPPISDMAIEELIGDFVRAACQAQQVGFEFVDLKHCHGYLGHEFLSAHRRPGPYGGSFENRTRFLREIVAGIRRDAPGLEIGVRLSAFDSLPFRGEAGRPGKPLTYSPDAEPYPFAFGADPENPLTPDLGEPIQFLELLRSLKIELVNLTAGSPYYNPHIQRPAYFPPSDGYLPPEDPLLGVARQLQVTAALKDAVPELVYVGTAYSYLQEWLPHVAQAAVRLGQVDFVGLGRVALSYPDLPADVLAGRALQRKRLCRTFSDCTSAPRQGLISGCYPLDEVYRTLPQAQILKSARK